MLRDQHDAEDAVQEVFVELWRSAGRFDPAAGTELTFVLTIAKRRLIDRTRRLRRTPLPDGDALVDNVTARTDDDVDVRDELAGLSKALDLLRPEQRTVIELAYLDGQTHQEIARDTGMPLGTVKSHARRGLSRVREILGIVPKQDNET